jgi:tetratricopeptide (TPR) repeat protein
MGWGGSLPQRLWAQDTGVDRSLAHYQRLLQRHPLNAHAYYALGDAYIQKAREHGDMASFALAEQALRKALDLAPGYSQAARHLAYVFYSRHDFQAAVTQAQQALALNPQDGHAYGVLGDAYLETGQYAQAQAAYQRMLALHNDLYAYSRVAALHSLQGDPQTAIALLTQALQEGMAQQRPHESLAWTHWQLGNEHFALGQLTNAEAHYSAALTLTPHYYRALAGLAQVRSAQQQYQEAIALYQQAITVLPLPEYVAALGDVYTKLGRMDEAAKHYAMVEYIGTLNTLNQVLYNRELAVFYADHDRKLDTALALARKELEVRRDIYAYDLLAWVLYKLQRPAEALNAMHEALKLGTQDARLFFHAGMIYHHLGNIALAQQYLQRALATNPHFHIIHADLAAQTLTVLTTPSSTVVSQETRHGQ